MITHKLREIVAPLVLLGGLSAVFGLTDLDLRVESLFFVKGQGWVHGGEEPWRLLYDYGTWPALVMAGCALVVLLASFKAGAFKGMRKKALFFVLLMLIGPGLIVNAIFKEHWGRPRPREVSVFAGQESFLHPWVRGTSGKGHSFPCGHASMGFYLGAPYFVLRRSSPRLAAGFLGLGIVCGCTIGLARMIQGGHFPSDVMWSGGVVYLCGLSLSNIMGLERDEYNAKAQRRKEHRAHLKKGGRTSSLKP